MSKIGKFVAVIFVLLFSMQLCSSMEVSANSEPFAELVLRTNAGGVRPDYGLYIAQYLREINIEVEVKVEEWTVFLGTLLLTRDFDLAIMGLDFDWNGPELYSVDGELGSPIDIPREIPYGNDSESLLLEGPTIMDLEARRQHYFEWQQLVMDRIVPIVPLFTPKTFVATWANTIGFDARWGIIDSLPYMEFDGYHEGQESLTEFSIADANWRDLNPLQTDDTSSAFVFSLMSEPIIGWSPDLTPQNTSLVTDWEMIDDFHFTFTMRDNVWWNPSYNVTGRDENSAPLDPATTPLMEGLKAGEFSNGTNQQVTAKDAVFTYLAWANAIVSESPSYHKWISNCYVDPVDEMTFHIEIDGNPATPEVEQYVDFWARLPWDILPEFFLNSTDSTVSYTSGGAECTGFYTGILDTEPWEYFSTSAFGCGKYQLDYYIKNSVTVFQASPYWMDVGIVDGTTQDLDIVTFNIRIIPDVLAELAEFKDGKLDWISLSGFPEERITLQTDSRFDVQFFLSTEMSFMLFNLRRPFIGGIDNDKFLTELEYKNYTKGVAVRKAICYAIDKEEINQVVNNGDDFISHSVLPPSNYYYYHDIIEYEYDPSTAQEWLLYAGYIIPTETSLTFAPIIAFGVMFVLFYRRRKERRRADV